MLRTAVICPDRGSRNQLTSMLGITGTAAVVGVFDHYLSRLELTRLVRLRAPEVVFLSSEAYSAALATVQTLVAQGPHIQIVMTHAGSDSAALLPFLNAGAGDCIRIPGRQLDLTEVVVRLSARAAIQPPVRSPDGVIVSFLPGSPRAGASTVALNTALALARTRKVLLADLDLHSGMQRFMLNLAHPKSVADAAKWASNMDRQIWSSLVAQVGNLDVLPASPLNYDFRLDEVHVRELVEFWRPLYPIVCADLPNEIGPHALEILQESAAIFLVCTPEPASLYQARRKHAYMRTLDLEDLVKLIVNRSTAELDSESISRAVGAPICAEFSGNYAAVQQALLEGRGVDRASVLGRQFAHFAARLMGPLPSSKSGGKSLGNKLRSWLSAGAQPNHDRFTRPPLTY